MRTPLAADSLQDPRRRSTTLARLPPSAEAEERALQGNKLTIMF